MKTIVTLARTEAERKEAYQLVKQVYAREFNVNLDAITVASAHQFKSDIVLVRDEHKQLVGTSSMMYPNGTLYPSEYIFGANVTGQANRLPVYQSIEVARVAKESRADNNLIIYSLMLATLEYLTQHNLAGWIATVKPAMKRFLEMAELKMIPISKLEGSHAIANSTQLVDGYKGNGVCFFWASQESTRDGFSRLYKFAETGVISLDLGLNYSNQFTNDCSTTYC